jgi:hypothetical protein
LLAQRALLEHVIEQLAAASSQRRQSEVELGRSQKEHEKALEAQELHRQRAVEAWEESERVLASVATSVRVLTKQEVEEVRSLMQPPHIVRRALSLVFCLLHPDEATQLNRLEDVTWEEKTIPMLRRDDLVQRVLAFPQGEHPLITHVAVNVLIEQNVCMDDIDLFASRKVVREIPSSPLSTMQNQAKKRGCEGTAAFNAARRLLRRGQSHDTPRDSKGVQLKSNSYKAKHRATDVCRVRKSAVNGGTLGSIASSAQINEASSCSGGASHCSSDETLPERKLTLMDVNFGSRAVGALFNWVISQVRYARALKEAAMARKEKDEICIPQEARCLISSAVVTAMHEIEANTEIAVRNSRRECRALEVEEERLQDIVSNLQATLSRDRAKAVARVCRAVRAPTVKLQRLVRSCPARETTPACTSAPKEMEANVHWLWREQPVMTPHMPSEIHSPVQ